MKDKNCTFEFRKVSVEEVGKLLLSIKNDKPPGSDNLDGIILYLQSLQSKPTGKCVPSGLERRKSNSANQE